MLNHILKPLLHPMVDHMRFTCLPTRFDSSCKIIGANIDFGNTALYCFLQVCITASTAAMQDQRYINSLSNFTDTFKIKLRLSRIDTMCSSYRNRQAIHTCLLYTGFLPC